MKTYILAFGIVFALLFQKKLTAQQIGFHCTKVDTAGNITLFWSFSGTYQYVIYGSPSKIGTYDSLGTTTDTNFTHIGADGGVKQWFYVIKTVPITQLDPQYFSDTIGSILLVLVNQGEIAELHWTRPTNPPLVSQSKEFEIWRQQHGIWSLYAKTDTTVYFDTIHACGETLGYEIRLYDSIGNCESISKIKTDLFKDFTPPSVPQLDSVSINHTTGKTELGWNRSTETDVFGYFVYIKDKDGKWEIVDTVFGAETTHYIDTKNDANDSVQFYRIAAIDTCRNTSPMGDVHNTLLPNVSVNMCDFAIVLSWNAYCGMPDSITSYQIWASINGGAFTQIADVPDNQLSYTHNGVAKGKYVYFARAYNSINGYSSTSAKKEIDFTYEIRSDGYVLLRYASVIDNQDIEIAVFAADSFNHQNLLLYRSDNNKTTFSHIDTKPKINGEENYFFIDNNVDVHTHTYFYTVAITDEECNNIFAYSDTANNIVLEAEASQGDENVITWLPYCGFYSRLDSYDIFRRTQTESTFLLVGNLPATQLDYKESVWGAASGGGKFYYQISANEDNTNIYSFQDKSFSNIVEISKEAITYIPNMFSPSSSIEANRVFKPVNSYVDVQEYVFSIYDRWGSLIFITNDINAGWDGTVNGKPAAAGVYSYKLTHRLDKKNIFKKQGHVTLVR